MNDNAAKNQEPAERSLRSRLVRYWRRTGRSLFVMIVLLLAFRSAVADWNDVPTPSMNPTIVEGDRIFVNKLAYDLRVPFTGWRLARWSAPERGEIVVFFSPENGVRMVKRVVGLPGDEVALRNDQLFINGQSAEYGPLSQSISSDVPADSRLQRIFAEECVDGDCHAVMFLPQISTPARNMRPTTVPAGHYFLMGDNRDNSKDSRFWGFVPMEQIVGRSSIVVLSLDRGNYYIPRWDRFFQSLP